MHKLDVRSESEASIESTSTMMACISVFSSMMKNVGSQLRRLNERFSTKLTLVRFFPGMCSPMTIKRFLCCKRPVTLQTKIIRKNYCLEHSLTFSHRYGFSPVCIRRCFFKAPLDGNFLGHISQA